MSHPAAHVTDLDEVRRLWLPGCLSAHGLDDEAIGAFCYIVVEEIVEDVAELTVSDWPAADGHGRLRFDVASVLELCLPVEDLYAQVYRGWMRRQPRIGDVFGGRVDRDAVRAASGRLWDEPLERIIPGPLYELRSEARKVARLALYASVTSQLTTQQVTDMNVKAAADAGVAKARVLPRVGQPQGRSAPMTSLTWELPADYLEARAGTFAEACHKARDHLIYFLLNVGDGDTQLILLPPRTEHDERRGMVVDVATVDKLPALLKSLADENIIDLNAPDLFPLVIGTHPHNDHVGGMAQLLRMYGRKVGQYWEPGYYHAGPAYVETMVALEGHDNIRHLQPASGTTCYIDSIKVTVLTPGIGLRNRFDTYGIAINDASISLKVEFPATRIFSEKDQRNPRHNNRVYLKLDSPWALLLGADAQTTAWSQATVDFPELHRDRRNPALYSSLRAATGRDQLKANILKVPHHASKRGINLELMERISPRVTLISSVAGGGKYNFPHPLAVEALREAIQPIGAKAGERAADHHLGIHHTGARTTATRTAPAGPAGSIALLISPRRGTGLQIWRLGDDARQKINLAHARRVRPVRKP